MTSMVATTYVPLTSDRWTDFERLMGPKGGYGGCWCMLWRLSKSDYDKSAGAGNLRAMKLLANSKSAAPGLIAYVNSQAAGWISVAPRSSFPRMEKSRILKPVDDQDVWSVSCFLIGKAYRRQGIALGLLDAACEFAREHGAQVVEGYPISPAKQPYPVAYAWTGFEQVFRRAGFVEVARRSPTRPIMRKFLEDVRNA